MQANPSPNLLIAYVFIIFLTEKSPTTKTLYELWRDISSPLWFERNARCNCGYFVRGIVRESKMCFQHVYYVLAAPLGKDLFFKSTRKDHQYYAALRYIISNIIVFSKCNLQCDLRPLNITLLHNPYKYLFRAKLKYHINVFG